MSFALWLCVLLMTVVVTVKADDDDPDSQETGWFRELCVLFFLTK